MKNAIIIIAIVLSFYSCKENSDKNNATSQQSDSKNQLENREVNNQDDETSFTDLLSDLEEDGWEFENNNTTSSNNEQDEETVFSTSEMLTLFEASGISREQMEKLINNPDSLAILAQKAKDDRELSRIQDKESNIKGKLSNKQLSSKNTSTGVSLEEAILLVQAESGPEATMTKLKKIDSLAGTNLMQQMDLTEAGYVLADIARKNEVKASPEEIEKMESLRAKSGQMHSEKEAKEMLAFLKQTEEDIASGKINVSPQYQRTIKHQKNSVTIFHNAIVRKSKAAKKKFKTLNPDLYFGEDVGETYLGMNSTAVYLPLGALSFADEVAAANHPFLMTQEVKNVLGEPDKIETFDDVSGIYSLGLAGDLTVRFTDNALTNVNGPDLYIFEIGQIEPTDLEISKDGKNWIKVGKIDGGVAQVDIEKYVNQGDLFYYVRLKDLKKKSALPGADVDAIAAIGAAMRLNLDSNVLFDSGKSELKPEGKDALIELAHSIQVLQSGNVIIEGHTDDVGSNDTNQKLSLARARSVSAELKKLIPSSKFKWREKGLGESKPLVENDSEENRSLNRRVEILILPN